MSNPFLDHDESNNYGSKQDQLQETRSKVLESQKTALKSLANSEQIGVATANELMDQGEKLDRTNQRLDEIAEKQKISEKHIKNLNAGFLSGIVGLFKKKEVPVATESSKDKVYNTYRDAHLTQVVNSYKPTQTNYSYNTERNDGIENDYRLEADSKADGAAAVNWPLVKRIRQLRAELDEVKLLWRAEQKMKEFGHTDLASGIIDLTRKCEIMKEKVRKATEERDWMLQEKERLKNEANQSTERSRKLWEEARRLDPSLSAECPLSDDSSEEAEFLPPPRKKLHEEDN